MTRLRAAGESIGQRLRTFHQLVRRWLTSEIVRGLLAMLVGAPLGTWLTDPLFVQAGELPQALGSMFGAGPV